MVTVMNMVMRVVRKEGGDGKKKLNKQKQNRKGCLDLQDSFGQTPLHLASLRGNVEVVEYILDQAEMLGLQYGPSGRFRAGYHWRHRGLSLLPRC